MELPVQFWTCSKILDVMSHQVEVFKLTLLILHLNNAIIFTNSLNLTLLISKRISHYLNNSKTLQGHASNAHNSRHPDWVVAIFVHL